MNPASPHPDPMQSHEDISRFEIGGVKPSVLVPPGERRTCLHPRQVLVIVAIVAVGGAVAADAGAGEGKGPGCRLRVSHLRQLGIWRAPMPRITTNDCRVRSCSPLPVNPRNLSAADLRPPRGLCRPVAGTNAPGSAATVFRCPADRKGRFAAEGSSYEWNIDLNGHRIDETRTDSAFLLLKPEGFLRRGHELLRGVAPETTPLLLDYEEFHPPVHRIPARTWFTWTAMWLPRSSRD